MKACVKCGGRSDLEYGNECGTGGAPIKPEPICVLCLEKHYPDAAEFLPAAIGAKYAS